RADERDDDLLGQNPRLRAGVGRGGARLEHGLGVLGDGPAHPADLVEFGVRELRHALLDGLQPEPFERELEQRERGRGRAALAARASMSICTSARSRESVNTSSNWSKMSTSGCSSVVSADLIAPRSARGSIVPVSPPFVPPNTAVSSDWTGR